jgi:Flp pilus assembly protein TadB
VAVLRVVLVAMAIWSGMPAAAVAALWLASVAPLVGVGSAVAWGLAVRRRRHRRAPGPDDEAAFLHGVASEMAGGASPRAALVAAADRAPRLPLGATVRLAEAGMAAERIAPVLGAALPVNGRLVAGAWALAAGSGGPSVGLFQGLALRSAEEGALRRERQALTAQARASAWVVGGLPPALLAGLAATGRLDLGDPALAGVVAVGLALQVVGVVVVAAMVKRAR